MSSKFPRNCLKIGNTFYFKKLYRGKWYKRTLETSDYREAERKAASLRRDIVNGNWDHTPRKEPKVRTVEDLFKAFSRYFESSRLSRRTSQGYITAMRRILKKTYPKSDILELPLTIFTPDFFSNYQKQCFRNVRHADALTQNTAAISSHTECANAKGLFSQRALESDEYEHLRLDWGTIHQMKRRILDHGKHKSFRAPPESAIHRLETDLKAMRWEAPGRWLAAMLCGNIGLRRSEGIYASLDQFVVSTINGQRAVSFVVDITTDRGVKGSQGIVPVDLSIYEQIMDTVKWTGYVLPGTKTARENYYRANSKWLRSIGWDRARPNHELRKYFGAHVATKYDIFTAQSALRHTNVQMTQKLYAEILNNNRTVTVV